MNRSAVERAGLLLFLGFGIPLLLSLVSSWGTIGQRLDVLIAVVGLPCVIGFYALRKRRTLIFINFAFVVVLTIVSGILAYRGITILQVVGAFLLFYFFVMIVINFLAILVYWQEHNLGALVPFATVPLCIGLLVLSNMAGHRVRLYVFNRRLPAYEEAVRMMAEQTGDKWVSLKGKEIPAQYRHLAYHIHSERMNEDILIVTFIWHYGFPAKASALAYISDGRIPEKGSDFRREWKYVDRINENWFKVGG
jgi:hypothetical protein